MNQGTTEVKNNLGSGNETLDELRQRAGIMRSRIPQYRKHFKSTKIDLASKQFFPRGYEAGNAFGRAYQIRALPFEDILQTDLREAIKLYRMLIVRGGGFTLSDEEAAEAGLEKATLTERREYVAHRKIERNPKSARAAKKIHGVICQACGFDFSTVYGAAAAGYIEAHHLIPLSAIPEGQSVELDPEKDFAVLCANCHRTIHRKNAPKTVAALRDLPGVLKLRTAFAVPV